MAPSAVRLRKISAISADQRVVAAGGQMIRIGRPAGRPRRAHRHRPKRRAALPAAAPASLDGDFGVAVASRKLLASRLRHAARIIGLTGWPARRRRRPDRFDGGNLIITSPKQSLADRRL